VFKEGASALGIFIGVIVAIVVIGFGSLGIRYIFAGPSGQVAAREEILSGAQRITAYNHFFDLCASVQTAEQNLAAAQAQLAETPESDAKERNRLQTNITGLIATRQEAVNQYNADAAKDYTIGQFRASKLPFELPTVYEKGVTTTCVV
jgi:hypothetical protein